MSLPRTRRVRYEAVDNVYSIYEMANGGVGTCHVGRIFHPVLPQTGGGSLQIFGTDGNLIFGSGYAASIISKHTEMLPRVEADGWYHLYPKGDVSKAKWPQPAPGGFNYYHELTRHFIDCILKDRDPLVNVEWGLHITEMMAGAVISAESGSAYEMTTTIDT